MKSLIIVILLTISVRVVAQDKIVGRYRDYFGSRIILNADRTFKYMWHFDMLSSWTKGTWTLQGDTVYFHMIPTYDTLSKINTQNITLDSLILSIDEIPERYTQAQFAALLFSGDGQNRNSFPDKLVFIEERLYKIKNGKLVVKKQKGFWTEKKWDPWYFKSNE
jgi:hypothetical protein